MAITINVNLDEILQALKDDLDFTGNADKYIKVNATADGFEFAAVSSGATWGSITGTLSDQTDLQNAFDAKANLSGAAFTGGVSVTTSGSGTTFNLTNSGSGTTLNIDNSGSGDFFVIDTNKLVVSKNGNLAVDTDTLFVDSVNDRVGVGTSSPSEVVDVLFSDGSTSPKGMLFKNINSDGRASIIVRNNNDLGGAIGTYGSSFQSVGFRNDFSISATNSLIFLSDSEIFNGGSSTISFTAGGFGVTPAMTIFGSRIVSIGTTSQIGGLLNIQSISTSSIPLLIKAAAGQTANLLELRNGAAAVLTSFTDNGAWNPASLADANADNGTVYYSTDQSKLVYKDGAGVVNDLY